jgi:chemotaxis family two-component system sensor kinase Cph1
MKDDLREELTVSNCEKEAIHIPGLIQPFGLLLCLSESGLRIDQVSSNVEKEIGRSVDSLLGQPLSTLISVRDIDALGSLQRFELKKGDGVIEPWSGVVHREGKNWIIELEKRAFDSSSESNYISRVEGIISEVRAAGTFKSLFDASVREVQRLTGYDRVMMYRFDSAWNGEVVAEARSGTGVESYLGHHFPATDIPPQARAVFLSNWIRMIPDVDYVPVPVVPALHPDTKAPLDMSLCFLRSVSPIHRQYLRHMDVRSTLTISLIDGEKLWGLIACHHSVPKLIGPDIRSICRFIGKLVSSQLHPKEQNQDFEYGAELAEANMSLVATMAKEEDLVLGLVNYTPNILALAGTRGIGAAIRIDNEWTLAGRTPSVQQIDELSHWLSERMGPSGTEGEGEVFRTDRLSSLFPEASQYSDIASGLLAIQIPKAARCFVMWFKPEVLKTVTWAGNPRKNVEHMPDGSLKIEPRASFEGWKEVVRCQALPWKAVEIDAALKLKYSIVSIDLKRQFEKEKTARAKAERVSREKEELLATVSHDLKNPLAAIDLMMQLFEHKYEKADLGTISSARLLEEVTAAHTKVKSSTKRMRRLIHDLLDIAKIDESGFVLDLKQQDISELFSEVLNGLRPFAEEKNIQLNVRLLEQACPAMLDEDRVIQVLSNIVGNALKFTPAGGVITLAVEKCDQETVVAVEDSGVGISADHLPHVFDRFWQAQKTSSTGTGLGLAICKGIVEAHGGKIWIESTLGHGTKVSFSLPHR